MTDTPRHSVSVAAAVVDDAGRALVIRRRDNGRWEPPGGVLELEESIPAGLAREVREETGLAIVADAVTGVYKNMTRGIVALVFRCHATGGALSPNDEADAFRWLSPGEIPSVLSEAFAVRLLDALEYDGAVRVRSHDGERLLDRAPL